jgi:RimJ/RimL family protein N-acetyltransferase
VEQARNTDYHRNRLGYEMFEEISMEEKIYLKPKIRSELIKIKDTPDFEIYQFTPSLFKAFPFYLEKITLAYRLRCALEYFVGYKVFYIKKIGIWGGYCIVSNGRNARYYFCSSEDITFGRYFVIPDLRGQGIGLKMIYEVLNNIGIPYRKAYAYVHAGNEASHATLKRLGCIEVGHFDKVGRLRRIIENKNGTYSLYFYEK